VIQDRGVRQTPASVCGSEGTASDVVAMVWLLWEKKMKRGRRRFGELLIVDMTRYVSQPSSVFTCDSYTRAREYIFFSVKWFLVA
jgi:hypothetical protein